MSDYRIITECRLCAGPLPETPACDFGSTPLANAFTHEPNENATRYPLALTQCPACKHVQVTCSVDPAVLFPATYPYESSTSPVFRHHLADLASDVSAALQIGSRVLEIGSNDGTLLKEFKARGHEVVGIDPAKNLAAAACLDGVPTYSNEFNLSTSRMVRRAIERDRSRQPAAIVAANVMAHIESPREFVAGVAELLPTDGLFVFENGYFPDIIETNAFPAVYHEHRDQYHLTPLVSFFERYGLSLYDAHRVESQGGSIRGYVRKGRHEMTPRLHRLLLEERVDLQAFSRRSYAAAQAIAAELGKISGLIAIYGAPARLTTMAAMVGLHNFACFIVDDSPSKIGKYAPGTSRRILQPSSLHDALAPDTVLIAAWPYEADIRAQHSAFKGKWIVPLPEVRVVS